MSENLNALEKAQVLIEALPYIQRFNRKIIVVKYGGSAMVDEKLKKQVIQDVTLLKLVGFKPIIVHGGGKTNLSSHFCPSLCNKMLEVVYFQRVFSPGKS